MFGEDQPIADEDDLFHAKLFREPSRDFSATLKSREYIQDIYFSHHSFPNHSQEFVFESRSILKTFDLQQTPSRNSLFKGVPIDGLEAEIFRGKLWVRLNTDIYLGNEISFPRFVGRTELKFIRRTSRLKASRYQQLCFPQRRRNELIVRAF